jgi:mRNA interferase MazF
MNLPTIRTMKRGEVWWVMASAAATGGEVRKRRPGVIVSNDAANEHANRVQVVPVSSKTAKLYPCEAIITIQGRAGKAMADQVATVAKERLDGHMDTLSADEMRQVEKALRLQLGL